MTENEVRAEAELTKAREAERSREASWERSDTDGFLSQWASGLTAQLHYRQAEIERDGGRAQFPALFRDSQLVAAKQVQTRYGLKWGVLDSDDPHAHIGAWFAATDRAARQYGYTVGTVWAPAKAELEGRGHGLSGSCWVATRRLDGGFSRAVEIVTTDRNAEEA